MLDVACRRMLVCVCVIVGAAAALGACAEQRFFFDAPIPMEKVINPIKCELLEFFDRKTGPYEQRGPYRQRVDVSWRLDRRQEADVTLKLEMASKDDVKGSVGVAPYVFGPSFKLFGERIGSSTTSSEIKFSLKQFVDARKNDWAKCPKDMPKLGLKDLLDDFYEHEVEIRSGQPRVGLKTLTLTTSFGVTWAGGAQSGVLQFIRLGSHVGFDASASRSDVHTLTIAFKGCMSGDAKQRSTCPD